MKRRTYDSDEGWLLSYADLITNLLVFFVMLLAAADISQAKMQQIAESISGVEQPESLSAIQEEIDAQIEREGLQEVISTQLTDEGLELSLNSGLVFDSGSSIVRGEHEGTLQRMLGTLVPYRDKYQFAVEGHTDEVPMLGPITNWELSSGRANAVRSHLQAVGVEPERIRVEGYADTVKLDEELLVGLSEEERLARHRRVVVRVY
ncbi:MAG: OmpA family protein [Proteobacteria bacterium]|nr:OmpA family protein [Pseudomonadota bacterium]MCP4917832.1 OmpA family protein [Pseudomonadota bacterium]